MGSDLLSETTIRLHEVPALLPRGRNGAKPHLSTILRWIAKGVRSPTGETVRLEALRLGSKWVTSREALARFCARLTPNFENQRTPEFTPRSLSTRQRSSERAAKLLEAAGI